MRRVSLPPGPISRRTLSLGHKYKLNIKYLLFSFYLIFCSTSSLTHKLYGSSSTSTGVDRSHFIRVNISSCCLHRSERRGSIPFGYNNIDAIARSVRKYNDFFYSAHQSATTTCKHDWRSGSGDRSLQYVVYLICTYR